MVRGGRVSCLAFLREPQQLASVVHGRGELIALQYHSRKNLYQAIECYLILIPFARRGLPVFRRHVVVGTTTLVATCKGHPTYRRAECPDAICTGIALFQQWLTPFHGAAVAVILPITLTHTFPSPSFVIVPHGLRTSPGERPIQLALECPQCRGTQPGHRHHAPPQDPSKRCQVLFSVERYPTARV